MPVPREPSALALTATEPRGYYSTPSMVQYTLRASRIVCGIVLVLVGIVLALPFVPGPGVLCIFGGLMVLSSEFHWAQRLRERMRDTAQGAIRRPHGR